MHMEEFAVRIAREVVKERCPEELPIFEVLVAERDANRSYVAAQPVARSLDVGAQLLAPIVVAIVTELIKTLIDIVRKHKTTVDSRLDPTISELARAIQSPNAREAFDRVIADHRQHAGSNANVEEIVDLTVRKIENESSGKSSSQSTNGEL